jgi:hypothetical protein
MTVLLDKAIAALQQLAPDQQDAMATLILEELADEQRWENAFAHSQDTLTRLAEHARAAKRAGKTSRKGWDEL